jgi:pimeloyl-ACP methyl ester carboxylesterase
VISGRRRDRVPSSAVIAETCTDEVEDRKYFLDHPSDDRRTDLTFVLNLHGGGSVGMWQRLYFPAKDFVDDLGLVVATPSSKTKQPMSHWTRDADDEHLERIARQVLDRFGDRITSFWLVGHSQGGMTSSRLLAKHPFFAERVDGWLSLSGGRVGGQAPFVDDFGPPRTDEEREQLAAFTSARRGDARKVPPPHEAEFSFIFCVGEHEITSLPETSTWAERFGNGPRQRRPDVVDTEPGQVHDGRFEGRYKQSWGREPRPGTAQLWVYPGERVVADVVRLDKGHTEGLEPNITRALLELMTS